jgi:hypothetical protein
MKLRRLMQNCPLRTKPTKGQRCASQQIWLPMSQMGLGRVKTRWKGPVSLRFGRAWPLLVVSDTWGSSESDYALITARSG